MLSPLVKLFLFRQFIGYEQLCDDWDSDIDTLADNRLYHAV